VSVETSYQRIKPSLWGRQRFRFACF